MLAGFILFYVLEQQMDCKAHQLLAHTVGSLLGSISNVLAQSDSYSYLNEVLCLVHSTWVTVQAKINDMG